MKIFHFRVTPKSEAGANMTNDKACVLTSRGARHHIVTRSALS